MKLILQKEGFNVFFAENGKQALELWQSRPVDLVLLDVVMPSLDGFELCRQLRRLSSIPVIFLTAMEAEQDVVKGFDVGGYDYILKPFRLKELLARIYAVLRRSLPHMAFPERQLPKVYTILQCDFLMLLRHRVAVVMPNVATSISRGTPIFSIDET
jgi:DNA-binding response OmpR family regulator